MEMMGLDQLNLSRTINISDVRKILIKCSCQAQQETLLCIHNLQHINPDHRVHMLHLRSCLEGVQEEEEEVLFGRVH